jgi:hypothetical protein
MAPVSKLGRVAQAEFDRLMTVLRKRGVEAKIDIGVVTEAARVKGFIDAECEKGDRMDPRVYKELANLRRGLIRELGLVLQPSRARYAVQGGPASASSPDAAARWSHLLEG